jgi:hypothetical protein
VPRNGRARTEEGSGYTPVTWSYPQSTTGQWWTEDVALELWVEAEGDPVVIRLAGTLDGSTATNLLAIVRELIEERPCDIDLRASDLNVLQPSGGSALHRLERLVRRRGGRLNWSGPPLEWPRLTSMGMRA